METTGLDSGTAARLLNEFGRNEIEHDDRARWPSILLAQFTGSMFWLLVGAVILSAALREFMDAMAIGAILLLNGTVGFIQEFRSEKALAALRAITAPQARVLRDSRTIQIPAAEIVPGDTILVEAGDIIAGDGQFSQTRDVEVNEAILTGESRPVPKSSAPGAESKAFMGTSMAKGSGTVRITATGMRTEFGQIASLLAGAESGQTPLHNRLARVSHQLIRICAVIVGLVAALGLLRGNPWHEVILGAVALAVAAVPEGLLAVVTVALAIGVQRMAARRALVRKLGAVETLGSATIICTDKTGTLTEGRLSVSAVRGADRNRILFTAAACCDAVLHGPDSATGDPLEVAILREAELAGIDAASIEASAPRIRTSSFDSDKKIMSILRGDGTLYVKGAPEAVAQSCSALPPDYEAELLAMARDGLRIVAVAAGRGPEEAGLTFLGLIGFADRPREGVARAIEMAHNAGIRICMITGDHPETAKAIAEQIGLDLTGSRPDTLFARSTPAQKLQIVRDLKESREVVAMTGDGVNDAPALKEAHIGIAMGQSGSEVTREAAHIVLADDNFSTIVSAIREGRAIYENIRKTLIYLLSGNAAELLVMLGAAVAGLNAPFLALHLLWINLVTDGLPALALASDPPAQDIMQRPPRAQDTPILGAAEWKTIAFTALIEAGVVLAVFVAASHLYSLAQARSFAFSVLVFSEALRAFSVRDADLLFTESGIFSNTKLLICVLGVATLQLLVHHMPLTQSIFSIEPMSLPECGALLGIGMIPVSIMEVSKLAHRALK